MDSDAGVHGLEFGSEASLVEPFSISVEVNRREYGPCNNNDKEDDA